MSYCGPGNTLETKGYVSHLFAEPPDATYTWGLQDTLTAPKHVVNSISTQSFTKASPQDPLQDLSQAPTRILVIISTRSAHWESSKTNPRNLEPTIIALLRSHKSAHLDAQEHRVLFVAQERWNTCMILIFDVGNHDYESSTAHLPGHNILLVVTAYLSKKETVYEASPMITNKVNEDLRRLHDRTGIGS